LGEGREAVTAPLRAPVNVEFKATGVEQVRNGLKLVGKEGDANLQKLGTSSRQLASGVESIARAGKLTGEGMKQIISQGAEMAFMFGATGAIVGAIAVTGLAIYEHITGKIQEAKDELNKFRGDLEQFKTGTDLGGAAKRQASLYSGDPNAIRKEGETDLQFTTRSQGIAGLRTRLAQQQAELAKNHSIYKQGSQEADAVRETNAELTKQLQLYREIAAVTGIGEHGEIAKTGLVAKSGEQTKTGFQLAIDKAQEDAEDAAYADAAKRANIAGVFGAEDQRKTFANLGVQTMRNYFREPGQIAGAGTVGIIKPTDTQKIIDQFAQQVQIPLGDAIRSGMAETIGGAISEGIAAGFESGSIGGAFKAAGKAILAGLGGIISQMGQVWVTYGISMTALGQALWNPLTSGPAAIAIGASLIALGSALGAVAHGRSNSAGGGGAYAASALPQIIDRGTINPSASLIATASGMTARQPINVTVIGPNDPVAQRQLQELYTNANKRGSLG
jgi:hypothetical protein